MSVIIGVFGDMDFVVLCDDEVVNNGKFEVEFFSVGVFGLGEFLEDFFLEFGCNVGVLVGDCELDMVGGKIEIVGEGDWCLWWGMLCGVEEEISEGLFGESEVGVDGW